MPTLAPTPEVSIAAGPAVNPLEGPRLLPGGRRLGLQTNKKTGPSIGGRYGKRGGKVQVLKIQGRKPAGSIRRT